MITFNSIKDLINTLSWAKELLSEMLDNLTNLPEAIQIRLKGKSLTLVGANFASDKRKVVEWKGEPE